MNERQTKKKTDDRLLSQQLNTEDISKVLHWS